MHHQTIFLQILALTNLIASLIMAMGCVYAAVEMHLILLSFVFRWPMELFDTTPTGRVMNRFSKDIDVVDNVLPHVLRSWIFMFFGVILNTLIHLHYASLYKFFIIFASF